MVACYLVAFGFKPPPVELNDGNVSNGVWFQPAMTATEAIQALRTMRPGSIETKEQEEAVSNYCSLLWKRRGLFPPEPAQPTPSRPEITGKPVETTDLLVLCGIPGSDRDTTIVITEKMDGANMGISLSPDRALVVQNRSRVINSKSHRQFRDLDKFLNSHRAVLYEILHRDAVFPGRFVLYGEWLAATHSIPYSKLGSHFYAFDLYDRETGQFWDRASLQEQLAISAATCQDDGAIQLVPKLWEGHVLPPPIELVALAQQRRSQFYDGPIEGIYIKWERLGHVKERCKVVRSDFLAGDAHWSQRPEGIRFNTVSTFNNLTGI
ncbi:hypothetical protein AM588_10006307 [Phytophthora nicotianae]|uniref:Uncharacterized protein n=1 Tax=Phytophthora nicotianae TaxID=4792 RepID=A0A0W8DJX8_PHYNI|nr:hypothetical protein AM588_10006307 [Phytophthora nicotianae]